MFAVGRKLLSRLAPFGALCAVTVLAAAGGADARRAAIACGDTITADVTLTANVTGCPGDGLIVAGNGVLVDLNGHVVSGSGIGSGIVVTGTDVTVVDGFVRSFAFGVRSSGDRTRLSGLTVTGNGIGVVALAQSGVVDNSVLAQNTGNGLTARGAGWTVADSMILDNGGAGLSFFFAGQATIKRNSVAGNAGSGIEFLAHVDQSVIADNGVARNGGHGILVADSTTQVLRNLARRNGNTGILLSEGENPLAAPFYVITGNSSNDNAGAGIAATPGMTDGGGNSAKHNDVTPECVNVACSKN